MKTIRLAACLLLAFGLLLASGMALTGCRKREVAGAAGGGSGANAEGAAAGARPADGSPAGGESGGMGGPGAAAAHPDEGPDLGDVAQVGKEALSHRSFQRYLNDNAGEENEEGDQIDAIKSRLLDQFIEEHLLIQASAGLKIAVSDAEVDAYLKELGLTEGDIEVTSPEGKAAFRERIKSGIVVQKVKEAAVLTKIQVTPGEIDDAIKKRPELTQAASTLVLRQIMLDDKKAADDLARRLQDNPGQFEALAKERSQAPDKGQPRSYTQEDLPPDLRAAVLALQPGQVSPVLEHSQIYLIFQLVRKVESTGPDMAEVRHRIESELFRQKADQVMDGYLADLKKKTEIHVNRSILSFKYTGEFPN